LTRAACSKRERSPPALGKKLNVEPAQVPIHHPKSLGDTGLDRTLCERVDVMPRIESREEGVSEAIEERRPVRQPPRRSLP